MAGAADAGYPESINKRGVLMNSSLEDETATRTYGWWRYKRGRVVVGGRRDWWCVVVDDRFVNLVDGRRFFSASTTLNNQCCVSSARRKTNWIWFHKFKWMCTRKRKQHLATASAKVEHRNLAGGVIPGYTACMGFGRPPFKDIDHREITGRPPSTETDSSVDRAQVW